MKEQGSRTCLDRGRNPCGWKANEKAVELLPQPVFTASDKPFRFPRRLLFLLCRSPGSRVYAQAPSRGFPMAFAFALRLQWRDRAGLEPASLFAELLRNIESICLYLKCITFRGNTQDITKKKTSLTGDQAVKVCGGHAADEIPLRSLLQQPQQLRAYAASPEQRAESFRISPFPSNSSISASANSSAATRRPAASESIVTGLTEAPVCICKRRVKNLHLLVEDIVNTLHAHPTVTEALREAALAFQDRAIHFK